MVPVQKMALIMPQCRSNNYCLLVDKETKAERSHMISLNELRECGPQTICQSVLQRICALHRERWRSTLHQRLPQPPWFNVPCSHPQILEKQCGLVEFLRPLHISWETDLSDGGVGVLPWGCMLPADQGHMPVNCVAPAGSTRANRELCSWWSWCRVWLQHLG